MGQNWLCYTTTDEWIQFISERLPEKYRQLSVEQLRRSLIHTNYQSVLMELGCAFDFFKYKEDWKKWKLDYPRLAVTNIGDSRNIGLRVINLPHMITPDELYELVYNEATPFMVLDEYRLLIRSIMANDPNQRVDTKNRIKTTIAKISQSSIFKNYTQAARAYNQDHLSALGMLLEMYPLRERQDAELSIIESIVSQQRSDLLEYLMGDAYGCWVSLTGYMHPLIIQDAMAEVKNLIVTSIMNGHEDWIKANINTLSNKLFLNHLRVWFEQRDLHLKILY